MVCNPSLTHRDTYSEIDSILMERSESSAKAVSSQSNKRSSLGSFLTLDRGTQKLAKVCLSCDREFTWRKKWERVWDEVTTCSDRCKAARKRLEKSSVEKEKKILRVKKCCFCSEEVELAYRVKYEREGNWEFVCRPCWPKASGTKYLEDKTRGTDSSVSMEENVFEELGNPFYIYGGTWKATIGESVSEIEARKKMPP